MTTETPQPHDSPQPQQAPDPNPPPRPRRLWPIWVVSVLVPAILFLLYDVVLPTLEWQRIQKVVTEEVKLGDNWYEAEYRLQARGANLEKTAQSFRFPDSIHTT